MTYVPVGPPPVESPRVRELSQRLAEVIEEFEKQYPPSRLGLAFCWGSACSPTSCRSGSRAAET
jgi:hypothetical protein